MLLCPANDLLCMHLPLALSCRLLGAAADAAHSSMMTRLLDQYEQKDNLAQQLEGITKMEVGCTFAPHLFPLLCASPLPLNAHAAFECRCRASLAAGWDDTLPRLSFDT